jgi:hypothetical protein
MGVKPALLQSSLPSAAAVMGLAQDAYGVVGASDHWDGVTGQSYWSNGITGSSAQSFGVDAATDLGPAASAPKPLAGPGTACSASLPAMPESLA